jgi:hypothetical protein
VPGAVRGLRWTVVGLLFLAAAAALLVRVAPGRRSGAALAVATVLLGLFVVGFAAYRFLLVRGGRYPAGKAFVQVGLVVTLALVALGVVREQLRAPALAAPVDLARPLRSADAAARAMAAELARHRPPDEAARHVPRLVELLDDPSPEVRRQAHESLVALAGRDAGGTGPGAAERWSAYWRSSRVAPPGR